MKVAIIGGGAAGFFAAISSKLHHRDAEVTIFEKGNKLLAKVKVSGGGRCNVTHNCLSISELSRYYPRGEKFLKKAFHQFNVTHTIDWFESRGVKLKAEADGRMFPVTDDSQTIIDCLLNEVRRLGIAIQTTQYITSLKGLEKGIELQINKTEKVKYDAVIVATGGSPKREGLEWLAELWHKIEPPVPSLFTFNMPKEPIRSLMGLSVSKVALKVQGTKLKQTGPLLITHWGMSGPAVLKTSAWGARVLEQLGYNFNVHINWLGESNEKEVVELIEDMKANHHKRMVVNKNVFGLPARLWEFLLQKIELRADITWGEMGQKGLNKLINILINDSYAVQGKTTFKEEFVTCGGVALSDIQSETMQSRIVPNLYFAGEVMDIDGVTGGFNFQAAWTTGWIAGQLKQ